MGKYERSGDLFEDFKELLGCQFISDISTEISKCEACELLISPVLAGYELEQWRDMMEYLSLNQYAQIKNENEAKSILQQYLIEQWNLPG